jgi:hypothetical protein
MKLEKEHLRTQPNTNRIKSPAQARSNENKKGTSMMRNDPPPGIGARRSRGRAYRVARTRSELMAAELADSRGMEDGRGSADWMARGDVAVKQGGHALIATGPLECLRNLLALRYHGHHWSERRLVMERLTRAVGSLTGQLHRLRWVGSAHRMIAIRGTIQDRDVVTAPGRCAIRRQARRRDEQQCRSPTANQ